MDIREAKTKSQRLRLAVVLSVPAIIENLLITLVSIVDTAMVGALGANATTAVALIASPVWVVNALAMAINAGCSVLVARYIGAADIAGARQGARETFVLGIAFGVIAFCVMTGMSSFIPVWMGGAPEVCPDSTVYLRIVALGYPLYYMGVILNGAIRGYGNTSTPMKITAIANSLNIIGNFLLIYEPRNISIFGKTLHIWGAGMGIRGAAAATAFSTALSGLIALMYLVRAKGEFRIDFGESFRLIRKDMKDIFNVGFPAAVERVTINLGQVIFIRIVASLGTVMLAAHHIAVSAESICYQPGYGMQSAGTALAGQAIGANDEEMAEDYSKIILWLSIGLMAFNALMMYIFADPFISMFTPDAEVKLNAVSALRLVAYAQPFFGMYIVGTGLLRGLGDVKIAVPVSIVSMWFIRIPAAMLMVNVLGMGLKGAWYSMVIDLVLRGLFILLRVYSGKWKKLYRKAEL